MGKITIQEIATVLVERNGLTNEEAEGFVNAMFNVIQQTLEQDNMVKVKGLGAFKIIDVDPRESVNVNNGERVLIEGHSKISFTPDALMKEIVNKPFSHFETVVLNDGVEFHDAPAEAPKEEPAPVISEEPAPVVNEEPAPVVNEEPEPVVSEEPAPVVSEEPVDSVAIPLVDFEADEEVSEEEASLQTPEEEEPQQVPEEEVTPVIDDTPEEETAEEAAEAYFEEEEEGNMDEPSEGRKWLIPVVACLLGLLVGYLVGNWLPLSSLHTRQAAPEKKVQTAPVPEPVDSVAADTVAVAEALPAAVEAPVSVEPVAEEHPAVAKPVAEEKPVEAAPAGKQLDQYEAKDARVRTGAYRIVGTDFIEKAREGDNVGRIARRTLGPDMECYIEVYNNLTKSSELKIGQEIKIPKLELKKKKKPQKAE